MNTGPQCVSAQEPVYDFLHLSGERESYLCMCYRKQYTALFSFNLSS